MLSFSNTTPEGLAGRCPQW